MLDPSAKGGLIYIALSNCPIITHVFNLCYLKFQGDTTFTSQLIGHQVNAIEDATRSLFADRVTYYNDPNFIS